MGGADWRLLAQALEWYAERGFSQVDMPWCVPHEVSAITCPFPDRAWTLEGLGTLIGSAEQSFIHAQMSGSLPEGRFVSITPCFRHEVAYDTLRLPYFMKVELYSTEKDQSGLDLEFAMTAKAFMEASGAPEAALVKTDEGYDLEIAGVEVGSYSSRSHEGFAWTCGTGVAEPRFTLAVRSWNASPEG